jgi:type I restriction enzyme S subunit
MMGRSPTTTGGRDATTAVLPGDYCISVGNPNRPCTDGWRWVQLSDLARLESGHTPSRKRPDWWGGDIPWIGIRDATANHGRVISRTNETTNDEGISNSSARVLPADTVCLSRTASVGYVVVMGRPMATSQDFVNWVCGGELNPHFLKYALLSENRALKMFATGSVHQTIYFPEAKAFHICAPPRKAQDAIVDVLLSLDHKIELNRRMNETLERMALAIFRDWFVDFGPTRAKIAGQTPYLSPDLWALFPDRLADGGKPDGWETRRVGDFFSFQRGLSYKGEFLTEHGLQMLNLGCFKGGGSFDYSKAKPYSGDYKQRHLVRGGDLLVANTDMTQHRLILGSPTVVRGGTDEEFLFSHHVYAGRPKTDDALALTRFFYFALLQPEFRERAEGFASGTTVLFLPADAVEALEVTLPNPQVSEAFLLKVAPLFDLIERNENECDTLAQTRDLLLPRLMSGELHIESVTE